MSYEAVPCMVRAPSQDGSKGTILGVIIRPSSSQEGTNVAALQTPPGVVPIKGAKSIVIQPGSKRSLIISNDQIQKMVTGRGVRMSPHPLWSPLTTCTSTSSTVTPQLSLTSPQWMEMGLSPSSSVRIHSGMDVFASCTPDSGIQSVPTTPPQTSHRHKSEERAEEETKFDDMPRLRPMDEDEANACCTSSLPPPLDESTVWHASECETSLPSSLTNTSWNPEEIATQLLSMAAFDPRKIQEVTALMLQRSKEDVDKKEVNEKKRKHTNTPSLNGKKKAKRDYCQSTPSTSKETKGDEQNREVSEEEQKRSEEEPLDEESILVKYRLAIKRKIMNKVEETSDRVFDTFSRLCIGDEKLKKRKGTINPLFTPIQWDKINARRTNLSEILAREMKEHKSEGDETRGQSILQRKRRKESNGPTIKLKRRAEKEEDIYENIQTNVAGCSSPLPSLPPPPPCLCTRGGCLSPAYCLHRSLRVFCTPSTCRLPSCANRLSSSSSLFLSKGILKTKEPKKANQFLGEMVGEIVSVSSLSIRSHSSTPRCFALTPHHYIDCSSKGNMTRYITHSCRPNSSLQIWWESSVPHLCIFSLFPIASNSEITADLSFLTPWSFDCHCCTRHSARSIPSSFSFSLHQSILHTYTSSPSLYLPRNVRQCARVEKMKRGDNQLFTFYLCIDQKFRRIDGKVKKEYASVLHRLRCASLMKDKELCVHYILEMEQMSDDPVDIHSLSCIRSRISLNEKEDEEKDRKRCRKNEAPRYADTSYLDSGVPVGSYDPDEWNVGGLTNDAIRCICGILEDCGEMIECEKCHYWLHSDCLSTPATDAFSCAFCVNSFSTPHGDVILKNQPQIRLDGCTYYKALENKKKMQIRLNECVYVRKLKSDNHKKILRGLEQKKGKVTETWKDDPLVGVEEHENTPLPRSVLRVFRVERLFETPGGHRFIFGFYYARPHETFCDENRLFHPNEVFSTQFYDTLPIDAVAGKCVVMETSLFCEGRPLFPSYKEQDVLVCEYQLDRNQRHFDKCKNSYFLNAMPYAFQKFEKARSLQRCFTPFTYSSTTIPSETSTCSQEEISRFIFQQSAKRINSLVERISSTNV